MSGSQCQGANAVGVLSVSSHSVWCGCSLVLVTLMGAAWNNTMGMFFLFSLTHALKLQEAVDLYLCCLALLSLDAFTNAK